MNYENFFKDLFGSEADYRKRVLLMVLIKNYADLPTECGYLKKVNNRSNKKFINILLEQNEDYLNYIKKTKKKALSKEFSKDKPKLRLILQV